MGYTRMGEERDGMDLCSRITRAREQAGLTMAELADRLAVSTGTVSRWEKGQCTVPRRRLRSIADATQVSLRFLQGDSDDPHDRARVVSASEPWRSLPSVPSSLFRLVLDMGDPRPITQSECTRLLAAHVTAARGAAGQPDEWTPGRWYDELLQIRDEES